MYEKYMRSLQYFNDTIISNQNNLDKIQTEYYYYYYYNLTKIYIYILMNLIYKKTYLFVAHNNFKFNNCNIILFNI